MRCPICNTDAYLTSPGYSAASPPAFVCYGCDGYGRRFTIDSGQAWDESDASRQLSRNRAATMRGKMAVAVTEAYTGEREAMEGACEVVAAYVGRWNLSRLCRWETTDAGKMDGRRINLRVRGRLVWTLWWTEPSKHTFTMRTKWLIDGAP